MSSSELLRKNPGNLLRNFLHHVLEMKSGEELQQRVYNVFLRRPIENEDNSSFYLEILSKETLILTLFNNTEIKIYRHSLLLNCITASGVPLNNIKEIQARLRSGVISEKEWEAFHIQTLTGTVLQVQVGRADYSPRIYEMLQSSRLTQFR